MENNKEDNKENNQEIKKDYKYYFSKGHGKVSGPRGPNTIPDNEQTAEDFDVKKLIQRYKRTTKNASFDHKLKQGGIDVVEELIKLYTSLPKSELLLKLKVIQDLLQYIEPKKKAVEVSGSIDSNEPPIIVNQINYITSEDSLEDESDIENDDIEDDNED